MPICKPWLGFALGSALGLTQMSWLGSGKAPCASCEQQPNSKLAALQSETCHARVSSLNPPQNRLFGGFFFPAYHQPCPRQLPGTPGICECPSQCSCAMGSAQCWFPAVIYSTQGLPCQALSPTSFFLCCWELEFLSALRSGLFFKTLLKALLFKIRFYFGRGLLSVSPFISKHVKSAKA